MIFAFKSAASIPPNPIKLAKTYQSSLTIIPQSLCQHALQVMKRKLQALFPHPHQVSIIPILKGGLHLGQLLAANRYQLNPMRASYYQIVNGENLRLPKPKIIKQPNINHIVNPDGSVKAVLFTEAVVETQHTLKTCIQAINYQIDQLNQQNHSHLSYPQFYTFTVVSKINSPATIPNLTAMFAVNPDIWVYGLGCDDAEQGRDKPFIGGRLSPLTKTLPQPPYATALFPLKPQLIPRSHQRFIVPSA